MTCASLTRWQTRMSVPHRSAMAPQQRLLTSASANIVAMLVLAPSPCFHYHMRRTGGFGPAGFAFLDWPADFYAGCSAASRWLFLKNAMHDLSLTLCRVVASQIAAAAAGVMARHAGKAALARITVTFYDISPLIGHLA